MNISKLSHILLVMLMLVSTITFSQVPSVQSTIGIPLDFSPEAISKFNTPEAYAACEKVYAQLNAEGRTWQQLTESEKHILASCDETKESVWDTEGGGCSWYCGMGPSSVEASSSLASQGNNTYDAENAHDFSYKSAWVEGASGYGIGEYLLYTFAPENPRINKIKIVNGYVKSQKAWENNSRVKKLNMYVNDELYAYLNLKDIMDEQHFSVPAVGHADRANYNLLKQKESWTIKFEIAEVYEGAKYDDVVIAEIFFDGLDVHCFAAGTKVLMANGKETNIEDLKVGQEVMSIDVASGQLVPSKILELASQYHDNLIELTLANGKIIQATEDHPFFDGDQWMSFNPEKTRSDYLFDYVVQMDIASKLLTTEGETSIVSIQRVEGVQPTFTIVKLEKNNSFIANGAVVGVEELRMLTPSTEYISK